MEGIEVLSQIDPRGLPYHWLRFQRGPRPNADDSETGRGSLGAGCRSRRCISSGQTSAPMRGLPMRSGRGASPTGQSAARASGSSSKIWNLRNLLPQHLAANAKIACRVLAPPAVRFKRHQHPIALVQVPFAAIHHHVRNNFRRHGLGLRASASSRCSRAGSQEPHLPHRHADPLREIAQLAHRCRESSCRRPRPPASTAIRAASPASPARPPAR